MAATSAQRVAKRRAALRAQGLRPIQIWVPDTRAPGFAEECARQAADRRRRKPSRPGTTPDRGSRGDRHR